MAKRISDIAKDLGITSKVIIEKCLAEGVPSEKVKGHMSTVSAGLEASIREWFASGAGVATAVETTEHVDLAKVKPARRRSSKSSRSSDEGASDDAMSIEAPSGSDDPAASEPAQQVAPIQTSASPAAPAPTTSAATPSVPPTAAHSPTQPATAHSVVPQATVSSPTASQPVSAPAASSPAVRVPDTDTPRVQPAVPPAPVAVTPSVPVPPPATEPKATVVSSSPSRPTIAGLNASPLEGMQAPRRGSTRQAPPPRPAATVTPPPSPVTAAPSAPASSAPAASTPLSPARPVPVQPAPAAPAPGGPGAPRRGPDDGDGPPKVIRPAPMNVPTRPTVIAPAGKKLEIKTPVRLAGPKVVRIEAPEVVSVPRARRDAGSGPGDMGRGGGVGADDDQGRSPRRKKRPGAPAAASTGAGAGAVPARRKGKSDDTSSSAWRAQDLIEREARLQHAGGFLKKRRHEQKLRTTGERSQAAAVTGGVVKIPAPFTIKDLSAATGVKGADIVKKLFMQGIMTTINAGIDAAKAQEIMIDFNIELEVEESKSAEEVVSQQFVDRKTTDERPRGPVVTILGHVDHGKTSLLDNIRKANVAAGEAGGITQATSAFRVPLTIAGEEKHIVFLDTPGHKAFTEMRARGASITDVVVLVVSAPEGVAPQTIESINHAKAAKVPIVVALNKIDRPDATEARINQTLGQLAEHGLNPVEWGGTTEVVRTSATKGTGIEQLLEILDLQGQVLELKADFGGPARGTVVEAKMEEGRGAVANVLVQDGQLNVGDFVVIGRAYGRIRDIIDDRGTRHKSVGPGNPVQISGFDMLPDAGDKFYIVDTLRQALEAAEQRRDRERHDALAQPKVTLDTLFSQMATSSVKEIVIVLKADVQGSVDVLRNEIETIKTTEVKARVIHSAVGGINESDVLLADASKAIIVGFNVIASGKARSLAESKGVEIRTYDVIYDLTDDIKKAAEGLLAPELRQEVLGHAEVRKVFKVSKVGTIAGCYITDGMVERDALIRVTRNGVIIEKERKLEQLKRLKDDAKEVRAGMECGMKIVGYDDIREGDVLECYKQVEVKRTL